MLPCEYLGGCHQHSLPAVSYGNVHSGGGANGFAASNVADKDPVHWKFISHVGADVVHCFFLPVGKLEGNGREKFGKVEVSAARRAHGAAFFLRKGET